VYMESVCACLSVCVLYITKRVVKAQLFIFCILLLVGQ